MLIDQSQYELTVWIWLLLATVSFVLLIFIRAPYGRHQRSGWGYEMPARTCWIIMESPAIIVMSIFFGINIILWDKIDPIGVFFYFIWMSHYINRSAIWPLRAKIKGKTMPISIALFALVFNSINAWINAEWIFNLNHPYPENWLFSKKFIFGFILFITGMIINIKSDNILFKIRKRDSGEYKIPKGGLFKWISSPNYFGEILEWIGWAVATWSLAGFSFAIWVIANLVPRAKANHFWYRDNFKNYPKTRKALIPKIW